MDYKKRAMNLMSGLEEKGIDACIVSSMPNMRYYSGFTGDSGALFINKNDLYLFTDFRYREQAAEQAPDYQYCEFDNSTPLWKSIAFIANRDGSKTIGFEEEHLSYSEHNKMLDDIKNKSWMPVSSDMIRQRIVKDDDEIENMKTAGAIADRAFEKILEIIVPGMSEREIALELEYAMIKEGADSKSFDTIIASGENGSKPHAIPSSRQVQIGDLITMDFGAKFNGYCSDMTRTIALGDIAEDKILVYNVVLEAQKLASDAAMPMMRGCEVDAIAREIISKAGFAKNFGHGLGHSLGLEVHEDPRFSPTCTDVVPFGAIMTIEPGIYIDGSFGVRIEDFGLIGNNGFESFSHSPKELIHI